VTGHITEELALALVTLPPDDLERKVALEHAAECAACRALLDESEAMLRMLDADHELPAIDPAFKARVQQAVLGEVKVSRWQTWALFVGALLSLLMVWADARAGEVSAGLGVHCLFYELGCAVVPFGLVGGAMLRGALPPEPRGLALGAMAGALIGQALLLAECPAQGALTHTLAFHFAGVVLAAGLGLMAGRFLPARSRA
jgi:hypothetical protein